MDDDFLFPSRRIIDAFYLNGARDADFWRWCSNPDVAPITVPHAIAKRASDWLALYSKDWWVWKPQEDSWQVFIKNPAHAVIFRAEFSL